MSRKNIPKDLIAKTTKHLKWFLYPLIYFFTTSLVFAYAWFGRYPKDAVLILFKTISVIPALFAVLAVAIINLLCFDKRNVYMINLIQTGGNETMSKVIEAVFENGVFKPAKKLRLKDRQQVKIQILNDKDWQERFNRALKSIRSKTSRFSTEEIETDIAEAIKEVRSARRAY